MVLKILQALSGVLNGCGCWARSEAAVTLVRSPVVKWSTVIVVSVQSDSERVSAGPEGEGRRKVRLYVSVTKSVKRSTVFSGPRPQLHGDPSRGAVMKREVDLS